MKFLVGEESRLFEYLVSIKNDKNQFSANWAKVAVKFEKNVGNMRQMVYKLKEKGYIKNIHSSGGRNTISLYEINSDLENSHFSLKKEFSVPTSPSLPVVDKSIKKIMKEKTDLYFICNEKETLVKIGISDNVDKRLRQHQTSNAEKLKIMRVISSVPPALEKEIHEEFDHLRKEGEWFTLNKELKMYIQYMRIPECLLKGAS